MADYTVRLNANNTNRAQQAFGVRLGLGRAATDAEIKQQLRQFMINAVREQETRTAVEAAIAATTPIDPT